ncbi:MAG: MurR/RpiR family transcriptional regulator [Caldilineaceae bacterium]|nr:MurR/RpiR family transcriptional regulator [Caldilineaceae bacterium]
MYRQKIREYYEHLSPSYRRVADFVMSHYYEAAFMTAAQLADAVDVDTTTVVRFSQRLGYNGYPELLQDIRKQVKNEIYSVYEPQTLSQNDPAALFKLQIEQDDNNLRQILIQNPPEHLQAVAEVCRNAERIYFVAEGYANTVAEMVAAQLRHQDIRAEAVAEDPVRRAATLANLGSRDLVIGISATEYGESVARALSFAQMQGCPTLGVVGSLDSSVNRAVDKVIYAPSDMSGPLPSIVALIGALTALAQTLINRDNKAQSRRRAVNDAYHFLTRRGESVERAVAQ